MLDEKTKRKIIEFVSLQPRSIDEIARHIGRNWRTANRYVDTIAKEGILAVKVFRQGTRGALKVVYLNYLPQHFTVFQSELYEAIKAGKNKQDFSPFDIWQYVDKNKKQAFLEQQEDESKLALNKDLTRIIKNTKKELLIFSGNLSWARLVAGKTSMLSIFEQLARRGVAINILCKVDIAAMDNVRKVLNINRKLKKETIKIRHKEQPLRAVIVDNALARLKEIKDPADYKRGELDKRTYIFYDIYDVEWISWLKKVFWDMFSKAISAEQRLKELERIKRLHL